MPHLTTDDGVKLYYEEVGAGMPIVFVHEFAGDIRSWEPQMRYFGRRYRCIAYNARGYPPSDVPRGRREIFAGARARRHPRGARRAARSTRRISSACRWAASPPLHFGFTYPERARSLVVAGCGYGAAPDKRAQFADGGRGGRNAVRERRHGEGSRRLRARAVARAVPEQGPARLAGVRRPACRAFDTQARR